jgi:glycosyltransferase involved in cell wall biosynthesis
MEIDALIPAYNEAALVGRTVTALFKLPQIKQVLVIDDGSTDGTAAEAAAAGAQVLRLTRNLGKGEAVLFGAHFSTAPYIALVDADLGDSAVELSRLMEPLVAGEAAMSVACCPANRRRGGFGLVKKLAGWSIYRCTGCLMREPLSGQRILRRELLQRLSFPPRGFGLEVALTLDLLQQGWPVVEVPTSMSHRERGRELSSFLHRGRQCVDLIHELWLRRERLLRGKGEAQ